MPASVHRPLGLLLIALPLIAAIALALYNAATLPIWYDEAITLMQLSKNPDVPWQGGLRTAAEHRAVFDGFATWRSILPGLYIGDIHPPMYYFGALGWSKLVGKDLFDFRLFSLLCVTASGILIALTASTRGYLAAGTATALFLFAPMVQWAAINARGYSVALLFTTAALYLAVRATETRDVGTHGRLRILGVALFSALAFYSHYFSILLTLPVFAYLLVRRTGPPISLIAASLLFAALLAAIAPLVLQQMGNRAGAFVGFGPLSAEIKELALLYLTALANQAEDLWLGRIQVVAFLALVLALAARLALDADQRPVLLMLVVSLAGFGVLLLSLFIVTDKSIITSFGRERYTMFIIPPMVVLIGAGLQLVARRQPIVAGLVVALLAVPIIYTWTQGGPRKEPWTTAGEINAAREALAEVPPEAGVAVIPIGFARGTPGTWASALDGHTRMIILKNTADLDIAQAAAKDSRVVVLAKDESGQLTSAVAGFARWLRQSGFQSSQESVFRRDPPKR